MRKVVDLRVVLLLVALCTLGLQADESWLVFNLRDAEVRMPGEPSHTTHPTTSPLGEITETRLWLGQPGASYTLSVTPLPGAAILLSGGRSALLDRATAEMLAQDSRAQSSLDKSRFAGYYARRLSYEVPDGRAGEALLVLRDKDLYVVDSLSSRENNERFLASFKLKQP